MNRYLSTSPSSSSSSYPINNGQNLDHDHDRRRHQNRRRRRLDVALVGAPNAGKSQLLNVLTQAPIAAVSRKRHTTRHGDILGVRTVILQDDTKDDDDNDTDDNNDDDSLVNNKNIKLNDNSSSSQTITQIVFKDTPGFLRIENAKEERLDSTILQTAAVEMQDVDFTLIVIDAARTLTETYQHALIQLMVGALHSSGRVEDDDDDEDDDYDDDNDDFDDVADDFDDVADDFDDDLTLGEKLKNDNDTMGQPNHRLESSAAVTPRFAVVLNKVDLVKDKEQLIPLAQEIGMIADACLQDYYGPEILDDTKRMMKVAPITFYVSALDEDGTDELLEYLLHLSTPCRSWAVPLGQKTNQTPEEQISEIIREKIYRCTHREVPHSVEQINRVLERRIKNKPSAKGIVRTNKKLHDRDDGKSNNNNNRKDNEILIIHQDLIVFTKSHHRLVMGNAGRTLQRIQDTAQRDLEALFQRDVSLTLKVKLNKSKQRRRIGE